MEMILRMMGHEGDPEALLISPVRAPIPEGLVGVPLRILAAEDNEFNRRWSFPSTSWRCFVRMGSSSCIGVGTGVQRR